MGVDVLLPLTKARRPELFATSFKCGWGVQCRLNSHTAHEDALPSHKILRKWVQNVPVLLGSYDVRVHTATLSLWRSLSQHAEMCLLNNLGHLALHIVPLLP